MDKRFNIRVYGIWIHDNKILIKQKDALHEQADSLRKVLKQLDPASDLYKKINRNKKIYPVYL